MARALYSRPSTVIGANPIHALMFEINEDYREIAERLIKTKPALEYIKDSAVSVVYLSSDEEKKKNYKRVLGECTKVSERYKWAVPFEFMITIYEPNCFELSAEQKEILLYHELQHIGINDEEGNEPKYYIVPHDIEEFWTIINEYGLEWQKTEQ